MAKYVVFFALFLVTSALEAFKEGLGMAETPAQEGAIHRRYHADCEEAINRQINTEFKASYMYKAMAYHFDRQDISLSSFRDFFMGLSKEGQERAETLMHYQNKRGGKLVYYPIDAPKRSRFKSGLNAMETALVFEKKVYATLLDVHTIAGKRSDPHLQHFLDEHFLKERVESIRQIGAYATLLENVESERLGEFQFDVHGFARARPRDF